MGIPTQVIAASGRNTVDSAQTSSGSTSMINLHTLCGIMGFSLYLAWIFLVLVGAGFGQTALERELAIQSVFLFFAGEALGALGAWFVSRHVNTKRAITLFAVMAGFLTILPGIFLRSSVLDSSSLVISLVWLGAGIGAVVLLSLWGFFLARLNHASATLYPAISVLIMSVLLVMVLVLMKSDVIALFISIFPLISVMIFFSWASSLWTNNEFVCPQNIHPPDWKSLSHSAIAMVANSFLIGFVIYAVSSSGSIASTAFILIGIVVAASFKMYDATHNQVFEVNIIIKVLAPIATVGLLLLPFVSAEHRFALLAIVMTVAMIDEIICWSAVSEYMHVHKLMPFANMAYGRAGDTIGLFLGYLCGNLIFGINMVENVSYSPTIGLVVVAFSIMQGFYFKDNYTPFTEHSTMDDDLSARDTCAIEHSIGHWKERCARFCEHYQLTPRQQEVLLLLAKGYATSSIEKSLMVSSHTIKAHIYGIYKKTDVHSRQELIERIEMFE